MAYSSASDVAALTKNILDNETMFSDNSIPTIAEVNGWMSTGCRIIESKINSYGYATPAGSATNAWGVFQHLNVLYTAAFVEFSRINMTLGPGERTRGQVFWKMFQDELSELGDEDLSKLGLALSSTAGKVYAGGIGIADKQAQESDTDRVSPRFTKRQMKFPDTSDPSSRVTAS